MFNTLDENVYLFVVSNIAGSHDFIFDLSWSFYARSSPFLRQLYYTDSKRQVFFTLIYSCFFLFSLSLFVFLILLLS